MQDLKVARRALKVSMILQIFLKIFLAVISLMPFKAVVADDHLKEAEHRMVMTSYMN